MNPLIQFKPTTLSFLIVSALMCFGLSPTAHAVSPAPDGGYPGDNTAEGDFALLINTTGFGNTANGFGALLINTTGNFNTATGEGALASSNADRNTATGAGALSTNSSGTRNTADGVLALGNNTLGSDNTAVGDNALTFNTEANSNTAVGVNALSSNTTGNGNVAIGFQALSSNTVVGQGFGDGSNVAIGFQALRRENGTGDHSGGANNGIGESALEVCTTGFWNNALGFGSLSSLNTGSKNTAIGDSAGDSITSGSSNICIGSNGGGNLTTGNDNIDIGNSGVAGESDTIRIGDEAVHLAAYIAGIENNPAGTDAVFVDSNGQLGIGTPSSARFKTDIKPMDKASEAILAMKPVTFRYKQEIDHQRKLRFGLVAEEVEKINPDLVNRDAKGQVSSVRYDAVNAMLLNEFLKEHRTVQEQHKEIDALKAELKEQRALIQKVSDKVELNKPAPRAVVSN